MPIVALVLAAILFLWSLLTVVRAHHINLFLLKVAATTYGRTMAAVSAAVLFLNILCLSDWGSLLSILAILFFRAPGFRALYWRKKHNFFVYPVPRVFLKEQRVAFGEGLYAECFYSESTSPRPLILVIHGGGWANGVPEEFKAFRQQMARLGAVVASIKYRLAPGAMWPAQQEDVLAALQVFLDRKEEFQIDPAKVFLMGRSAGGQIASAVACKEGIPPIAGVICFYSPFDIFFAYEHAYETDILKSPQLIRQYLGGTPEQVPEQYRSASAYHLVTKNSPPFLLFHGTRDDLVWILQSRRFAQKIQEVGGHVVFHEFPWATHAFDHNPKGPAGRIALNAIREFVFTTPRLHPEAMRGENDSTPS